VTSWGSPRLNDNGAGGGGSDGGAEIGVGGADLDAGGVVAAFASELEVQIL
jgi:hypothetical protein